MPKSSSHDIVVPKETQQIMQDDKFFSRLLSKESSCNNKANASCRVYYGVAPGAVPFMWESEPGTPKNTISTTFLPPLTPPPSYLYNQKKKPIKRNPKSNLLLYIFPRLALRKSHVAPSSSSSSRSPSSSSQISSPSKSSNQSFSSLMEEDCHGGGSGAIESIQTSVPVCFGWAARPRAAPGLQFLGDHEAS